MTHRNSAMCCGPRAKRVCFNALLAIMILLCLETILLAFVTLCNAFAWASCMYDLFSGWCVDQLLAMAVPAAVVAVNMLIMTLFDRIMKPLKTQLDMDRIAAWVPKDAFESRLKCAISSVPGTTTDAVLLKDVERADKLAREYGLTVRLQEESGKLVVDWLTP